ncbi:MAG: hypothetical protein UU48_C0004G0054 [Candidatus Uhrbacteria bacterium GW2011_GWF2_41_16]|uniref:NadR/Ttd14 AAA domain-containing protein n=1 Tax=Candidatus Uhrbacteria bacterium GW2011_GWF2_41_16 TaxID=1618997 RepID=A0A0G0VF26_9BACT|nr:MAG: transcriptional regulator NadR [Candidatus Peregrinibacteria bacterium GW2011_GWC2_39_14]KKR98261.1 MAG: hypothetical protein UU48_C0004G0054 [Candidatus Uhrbacteria bacterium GW2011_GWF2_41_16]HBP00415.1 histidine kinase [Candidatus Uhrbacteria bacterium]
MIKQHKGTYKHGLVIGKFYPPHLGHKYLIDTAEATCEKVTVILCWKRSETIPATLRAQWLKYVHPHIDLKVIEDRKLSDDDSEGWAKFTLEVLGEKPDAVFTSESYGDVYAAHMDTVHVLVDKERVDVPVSATMVRRQPTTYAHLLAPCVRGYFAKRVCVLGAESTGTTTLVKALAKHYQTVWVPEYGRTYSEAKLLSSHAHEWKTEEFEHIARTQNSMENTLAEISNGLVICDTNAFATGVWHERYLGKRSEKVEAIARTCAADLYIVTGDEIPFVQDGIRDGEGIRHDMHKRFIERLEEDQKSYIIVTGNPEERLRNALKSIEQIFGV